MILAGYGMNSGLSGRISFKITTIDENMPMLKRMYQRRLKAYSALGYDELK